jgi:hypothetical protein
MREITKAIKIIALSCMLAYGIIGCHKPAKEQTNDNDLPQQNTSRKVSTEDCTTCYIATTNQASNRIELYDENVTDWNSADALKWSWWAASWGGFSDTEISAWSNPSDVKVRNTSHWSGTSQVIVVTASGGLAAIAGHPDGLRKWARVVGGNPHSAELLPNGNIAIAASTGGWVRVYASSQGGSNGTYAQFNLPDAHGVLWDPANNCLWVLGDNLYALSVGGTAANPTLSEITTRRFTVPGTGHDLSPYYGDPNKLLFSETSGTWIYNKTTKVATQAPGSIWQSSVKAISNQTASGHILTTIPRSSCSLNSWCTDYVHFYSSTGQWLYDRINSSAAFYKGKTFNPEYQ